METKERTSTRKQLCVSLKLAFAVSVNSFGFVKKDFTWECTVCVWVSSHSHISTGWPLAVLLDEYCGRNTQHHPSREEDPFCLKISLFQTSTLQRFQFSAHISSQFSKTCINVTYSKTSSYKIMFKVLLY